MPLFHVYGVGNALVDLEYEIPEQILTDLGIDKGLMTLIEEDRHHELLDKLFHLKSRPCGGGSAANTITAVAQLGSKAFYSCKVANDSTGEYFLDDLAASGVRTNLSRDALAEGHTGKCIVLVTPDAERSMNTFLGITREISVAELDENALKDSQYVYIEGYLVPEVNARAAAVKAREVAQAAGVKTSLTLSDANMVKFFKDPLLEIIGGGLDMVFSNEEEAKLMFDADSIEASVTAMKTIARQFAITRGADGAVVFDGEKLHEIPAEKVTPIDSNGAGDIYAGAFMHGLSNGLPFSRCAELAGAAATTLVQQMGARLTNEQMQAVGKRFL
ncbi:MAG: adenosine kinase [Granulosicoccus sp.]